MVLILKLFAPNKLVLDGLGLLLLLPPKILFVPALFPKEKVVGLELDPNNPGLLLVPALVVLFPENKDEVWEGF